MINDPGNHWHKDDMPYEAPVPGITEPNYDEHEGEYYDPTFTTDYDPGDVPF